MNLLKKYYKIFQPNLDWIEEKQRVETRQVFNPNVYIDLEDLNNITVDRQAGEVILDEPPRHGEQISVSWEYRDGFFHNEGTNDIYTDSGMHSHNNTIDISDDEDEDDYVYGYIPTQANLTRGADLNSDVYSLSGHTHNNNYQRGEIILFANHRFDSSHTRIVEITMEQNYSQPVPNTIRLEIEDIIRLERFIAVCSIPEAIEFANKLRPENIPSSLRHAIQTGRLEEFQPRLSHMEMRYI